MVSKQIAFWCRRILLSHPKGSDRSQSDSKKLELKNDEEEDTNLEGNPRNKVALLPGHSLMDWIRLGNSGKDLTGVGGVLQEVTEKELAEHSSEENAWIGIRGRVYNVSSYMSFHPGGIPELMRGAGKDATKLFTEIHPWVNYESILKKCFVGRLVRSKSSVGSPAEAADFDIGCKDESVFDSDIKMCWCQTLETIKFVFQCKVSSPHVLVTLKPERRLRILIRVKKKLHVYGFQMEKKVHWPCWVSLNPDTGRLELEFTKKEDGFWNSYGIDDKDHALVASSVDEIETYHKAQIVSINQVTRNVRTFIFKFVDRVLMWVPVGHDIRIRALVQGIDCAKQYTPIPPYLPHCEPTVNRWHQDYICCMVKYYSEGALTPYLFAKHERDVVEIGGMSGTFNLRKLSRIRELYLIAAGSGLSPMLRILVWAIAKKDQVQIIKLMSVNRFEEDIIWRSQLDELSKKEKRFKVIYCLSRPGEKWTGLKGRVDDNMLDSFLPTFQVNPEELPQFYVCACGPIQFAEMIQKYLENKGYGSCSHCFIG